jgi:hypothetical protein
MVTGSSRSVARAGPVLGIGLGLDFLAVSTMMIAAGWAIARSACRVR